MEWTLNKHTKFARRSGPLCIIVLDGVGEGPKYSGNAVDLAFTPTLDQLREKHLYCQLKAHGTAVGMPSDKDMGNSEVGHNALGAGRVFDQGSKLVSQALTSGALFTGQTWKNLIENCKKFSTPLHFIGLLSDGNVHSHIDQLFALVREADKSDINQVRLHLLLDGRDVSETSALIYIDQTEKMLQKINAKNDRDYAIASGGGRMKITMDRYEADWDMVEAGWKAHVLGSARQFTSAREAIETFRAEQPGVIDQFLPAFVIAHEDKAIGYIEDNHSVVFFNFRGDRAIEISRAFTEQHFDVFDRVRFPNIQYAGMMQYDGDLAIPPQFLVSPPTIDRTFGEYLARNKIHQFAISETQKFGHMTYFWNGNRSGMFDASFEVYSEIPSDNLPFEQRPWMKAAEITDAVIQYLAQNNVDLVRINYANGDMVGHTGDLAATMISISTVDLCLQRLLNQIEQIGGVAIILADHGNADEMYELDKSGECIFDDQFQRYKSKTSHTLNPVPFIIFDPQFQGEYHFRQDLAEKGLANVAATALELMGYEPPSHFAPSLISFREVSS